MIHENQTPFEPQVMGSKNLQIQFPITQLMLGIKFVGSQVAFFLYVELLRILFFGRKGCINILN